MGAACLSNWQVSLGLTGLLALAAALGPTIFAQACAVVTKTLPIRGLLPVVGWVLLCGLELMFLSWLAFVFLSIAANNLLPNRPVQRLAPVKVLDLTADKEVPGKGEQLAQALHDQLFTHSTRLAEATSSMQKDLFKYLKGRSDDYYLARIADGIIKARIPDARPAGGQHV